MLMAHVALWSWRLCANGLHPTAPERKSLPWMFPGVKAILKAIAKNKTSINQSSEDIKDTGVYIFFQNWNLGVLALGAVSTSLGAAVSLRDLAERFEKNGQVILVFKFGACWWNKLLMFSYHRFWQSLNKMISEVQISSGTQVLD